MPVLSPRRRKTPKIALLAEAGAWLAAIGLALALVLPAPQRPAAAAVPPQRTQAVQDLNAGVYPRTCIKRVIDLSQGLSEVELVAEINRRCFLTEAAGSPAAQPRAVVNCASVPWRPVLPAGPPRAPCPPQSRAGSRPQ